MIDRLIDRSIDTVIIELLQCGQNTLWRIAQNQYQLLAGIDNQESRSTLAEISGYGELQPAEARVVNHHKRATGECSKMFIRVNFVKRDIGHSEAGASTSAATADSTEAPDGSINFGRFKSVQHAHAYK